MKKILLKTAVILMLVVMMCMGCVQANETTGYTFGISAYRTDSLGKYAYTFIPNGSSSQTTDKLKYIWNVQQHINGIANDNEVFYCLSQGYGDFGDFSAEANMGEIPNVTGGISQSIYSGPYRLKDTGVQDTLNSLYSGTGVTAFSGTTYNGLLWIFDNMYIPEQEDRIEFLNKIQCREDATLEGMSAYTVAEAMATTESTQDDITDIEIEIAQQLAIWRLTNSEVVGNSFPTIYLSVNDSTLDTYRMTYPEDSEFGPKYGTLRRFYVKMVYDYLVEGAQNAMTSGYAGDSITTVSVYANAAAQPVVTITREKDITGNYDVIIKKVDDKGNILPGASFHVGGTNFSSAGSNFTTGEDGTVKIATSVAITEQNVGTADTYTIVESAAPEGYIKYNGTIGLTVTKKESADGLNYIIDKVTLDSTSQASGDVTIDNETNTITITIEDEPIKGEYTVKLNKQDEKGKVLQGAVFTVNGTNYTTDTEGYATIASNVAINKDNVGIVDTYTINEITAPEGYIKYNGTITLNVTKKIEEENYILDTAILDVTSQSSDDVDITVQGNVITITVVDKEIKGNYTVKIKKQNEQGQVLQGAVFTVNGTEYTTDATGFATIADNIEINKDNLETTDSYTVEEVTAPDGYIKYNETITLNVTKKQEGQKYILATATLDTTSQASSEIDIAVQGNVITITVVNKEIKGNYTVKLNKQNEEGQALQGAVFTVNGEQYTTDATGFATIADNVEINKGNLETTDSYTVVEVTAPEGYVKYNGTVTLNVTKKQAGEQYVLDTAILDTTSQASSDIKVTVEGNVITITVVDKEIKGNYTIKLKKQNEEGQVLPGAVFTVNGVNYTTDTAGYATVADNLEINKDNLGTTDSYTIKEVTAPEGYIKYNGTITLNVTKKQEGEEYVLDTVTLDATSQDSNKVNATVQGDIITITVVDEKINGNYTVKLNKKDEEGKVLQGAVFTVNGVNYTTDGTGLATAADNVQINKENVGKTDVYTITEVTAPEGYLKYNETITLSVTKKQEGENYVLNTATLDAVSQASDKVDITVQGNVITIVVVDKEIKGNYTLKLNKQNEKGEVLQGAVFTVNLAEYTTDVSGFVTVADNVQINKDNVANTDVYTITEVTAPEGYLKYNETITLNVTKKQEGEKYVLDTVKLDQTSEASSNVSIAVEGNVITITVIDKEIKGNYTVKLNKQNEEGEVLGGAVFTVNSAEYTTDQDGFAILANNVEINKDNVGTVDTYVMNEIKAPDGYLLYNGTITLSVTKKQEGEKYTIDTATLDETSQDSEMISVKIEGDTITVIIIEERIKGAYSVRINKQNQKGEVLQGAVFTVNGAQYTTDAEGFAILANNVEINAENLGKKDTYKMTEIKAPAGYVVYDGEITLEVTKKQEGDKYVLDQVNIDETSQSSGKVSVKIEGETITVTIIEDNIDLALRKFISQVVDKDGTEVYSATDLVGRVPNTNTENLKNITDNTTTGIYNHTKQPVRVNVGDRVTYTLRIYNEGESDAYITEVTDYLPKYLEYVENNQWFREYGGEEDKFESKAIASTLTVITGASENLKDKIGKVLGDKILIPAFDRVNDKLSYVDIQIVCKVLQPEVEDDLISQYEITNIAEITGMLDRNQNEVSQDIDSTKENVNLPETEGDWIDYKDEEIGKKDYIPGQEDDDDFEKVVIVIPKYDLSLRKFITAVQGTELVDKNGRYIREPQVDTSTLKQGIVQKGYGTATYNHPKTPVTVKRKNIVTYTIRVYNEGNVDAYVSQITDYLPAHLEFLKDDELNQKYGWSYDDNSRKITTTITAKTSEDTAGIYTSRANGKLLMAYAGGDTLDYIDVKVNCKVLDTAPADIKQTNIVEIAKITDTKGDNVKDMDSTPNGELVIPEDEKLPDYQKEKENNKYVPGQQDDDDFDKVIVEGDFDLALRKFITKVNEINVDTRYPQVSTDENGKIKYTHTKDPVEVCYQDTVIYTIRVYNEGEIAGYANEITDDVPEGLEFIVDNEINKTYRWRMLDENKEVTEDVSKAKYLVTDYLSEEQQAETGRNNLIQTFNKTAEISESNPDYRDIQIAFKVTYQVASPDEESRILVNVAQISEDSNDDIDSKPSRDEEYDENPEDDIDYDNVKVKYFDLSLLKWVTQAIVVENGETKVIDTGHTGLENPEPIVKVEIKSKDVNNVIVKFAYIIKITNEGEIAGYANEITDYIPQGLKFLEEDNPGWYERENGIVATDLLKDTLLQPGESAQVEIVLTWINGEENLGTKINVAEISKDDNPSNTPDIDSTPDNKEPEEDDIDDAPVMLVIKTGLGVNVQYTILGMIVIIILVTGTVAIKKFVLI